VAAAGRRARAAMSPPAGPRQRSHELARRPSSQQLHCPTKNIMWQRLLLLPLLPMLSSPGAGSTSSNSSTSSCALSGHWMYCPEGPAHNYHWKVDNDGNLACFEGLDSWKWARGSVSGTNLTISFGDTTCPGAGPTKVRKWGTVNANCSLVVMHDTQPNCPKGFCAYGRIPAGSTTSPTCPSRPPTPPPPPLPPLPPPCPTQPGETIDTGWISCRAAQVCS
jgi:hypothetical protein